MNILVIQSPFMPVTIGGSNFGGIESYVDIFCRNAVNFGHNATLIATQDCKCLGDWEDKITILRTEAPCKAQMAVDSGEPKIRFKYEQLCGLINKVGIENFDLVVNNSDKVKVNNTLYQLSKKLDLHNVVTYMHNPPIFMGSDKTCSKYVQFMDRITYVANSWYNFNKWNQMSQKMHGVNVVASINQLRIEDVAKDIYKSNSDDYTYNPIYPLGGCLACVGRVTEQKNPVAVYDFCRLSNIATDFYGVLTQDKKVVDKFCEKLDSTRVNNIPFRFRENFPVVEKLKQIYDRGEMTISLSTWETYGITAAESFALGLPIVVNENTENNIMYFIKNYTESETIETDTYIVNTLGIILKKVKGGLPNQVKAFNEALDVLKELYNRTLVRDYFNRMCKFNNQHILDFKIVVDRNKDCDAG